MKPVRILKRQKLELNGVTSMGAYGTLRCIYTLLVAHRVVKICRGMLTASLCDLFILLPVQ